MKDLQEIKDEVAKEKGFESWNDCLNYADYDQVDNVVMIAMSRYADEKTAEFLSEIVILKDLIKKHLDNKKSLEQKVNDLKSAYDELEEENKHLRKAVKFKDELNNPLEESQKKMYSTISSHKNEIEQLKEENEFISRKAGEKICELKEENQRLRDQQNQYDDPFAQADIANLKLRLEDALANEKVSDQKNLDLALIINRLKAKNKKRKKRIKSLKTELKEANFHKEGYRQMLYQIKDILEQG